MVASSLAERYVPHGTLTEADVPCAAKVLPYDVPNQLGVAMLNQNLMRQMQNKLVKIQEELANQTVEATAGGGVVKAVATGQQKLVSIEIDPAAVDPEDVEMLQDLVVVAVNDALAKAQELASSQLSSLTGGMKIPGLF